MSFDTKIRPLEHNLKKLLFFYIFLGRENLIMNYEL